MTGNTQELIDIIRLIRTENVGPITFIKLVENFGSPKLALDAIPSLNTKKKLKIYSLENAKKEIELAQNNNIQIITYKDPLYPPLLKTTEDFPPILFVKGNSNLLKKSSIAIVGSRNCTLGGKQLAFNYAKELGENGFLISSGLAKGIDAAAHEGSLAKGTIAFLGGGVDTIYPKENTKLYHQIAEQGALVSEFPIGMLPIATHFPRRNRLIVGMARGVIIIEATLNSGSMLTAKIAADINREVFAVPGSPADPKSAGTNQLLKDGACLTRNIQDVLNEIKSNDIPASPTLIKEINSLFDTTNQAINNKLEENKLNETRSILRESLSTTPISVDNIINATGISASYINTILLELELSGELERLPSNKVALIKATK